jgi:hypothetical protein
MKNYAPYKCDVCTAVQKSTGNWRLFAITNADGQLALLIEPWRDDLADLDGMKHVCGDLCALVMFGWWLDTSALDRPIVDRSGSAKPLEVSA